MKRALLLLSAAALARICALAQALSCGVPVEGFLQPPTTVTDFFKTNPTTAVYTMSGQPGDGILVRYQRTTTDVSFKPRLQVHAPGGALLPPRARTFAGTGADLAAEYTLPENGQYTVEIQATDLTPGTFRLLMVRLNRPCANATLACGAPVSMQVSGKLDLKTYQVDARANDIFRFRLVKTGPFAPANPGPNPLPPPLPTNLRMLVFGADGLLMAINGSEVVPPGGTDPVGTPALDQQAGRNLLSVEVKSPVDGTLTAVVYDQNNNTAAYSVSASRLNGACGDRRLSCGSVVDAAIKAPAAADGYTIDAQAGDVFAVRLARADESGQLIPFGEIYDPSGKLLTTAARTPNSPHSVAIGTFTAATAGRYTVLAQDGADSTRTGDYTIALGRLNRPCTGASLGCSSIVEGKVEGLLRSSSYSFAASANDSFLIRLLRTGSNANFRPRVEIYDPQGRTVQTASTTDLTRINFTVPADGAYHVIVSDSRDESQSGTYILSALRLNKPCTAAPIECGKVRTGSIDGPLRFSAFTYEAADGDSFALRLLNPGGELQPDIEIYDPQGRKTGTDVSGNIRGFDVVKPAGGTYTVVALDSSRTPGQGGFSLQLLRTRNACGTAPAQGQTVSGVVTGNAPFASYTAPVNPGDLISLRSASFTSGFSALMEVYDPDGVRVDQGTYSITRRAAASGAYTVLVSASNPRSAGAYAFSWQTLNNPVNTASLGCGSAVPGSLSEQQQFRYYLASLEANDIAKLLLTKTTDSFNAQMELYDPAGARVATTSGETSQRLRAGGNYLVVVAPATANGETGTYSLALQRPNNPCNVATLACGQSLLRTIDVPGQIDAVAFDGVALDLTTLRIPARTGTIAPFAELYNESGTLVRGISTGSVTIALPAAGKYTLFVRDRHGPGLGSYRVSLQTDPACPVEDSQAPSISLVRPTGGEVIAGGSLFHIQWQSDDNVDVASHEIRLSADGGATFDTVVGAGLGGSAQSFDWAVPAGIAPTRTAVIRVTATDGAGNTQSAVSDLLTVIGAGFSENSSARLTYDGLNRILEVTYGDGRTITYTYDAAGSLVRVSVAGQ